MIIARIILLVLVVITAGLYVRVLLPPEQAQEAAQSDAGGTPAESTMPSAPELESAPAPQVAAPATTDQAKPVPLPEDQMELVIETLAPEYAQDK
jgi:hypothetical protein